MSTYTSSHQPLSESLTTETVDSQSDRREVAGRREPSRSPSTPSASPRKPPPYAARQRLTSTYIQGDFATGQRTLPHPVALVGTFATR
jgi:hypothetical protein